MLILTNLKYSLGSNYIFTNKYIDMLVKIEGQEDGDLVSFNDMKPGVLYMDCHPYAGHKSVPKMRMHSADGQDRAVLIILGVNYYLDMDAVMDEKRFCRLPKGQVVTLIQE
jgi:hypothetical protein